MKDDDARPRPAPAADPLELALSRRRFLVGAVAIAGAAIVVKAERPARSPLAGKPGTRWIGHC